MTQDVVSGGSSSASDDDRTGIIKDVVKALQSAGVTNDVADAVTNSLLEVDQETTDEIVGDGLPLSENARFIIAKRYLRKDDDGKPVEDELGLFERVSSAVSIGEPEEKREEYRQKYFDVMSSLKFLPNSPTLVNAGTGRGCLSACFVVSPEDNIQSIMKVANDAAMIEKWGGGIGFGLSDLRPRED